jgi:hypothetical protein
MSTDVNAGVPPSLPVKPAAPSLLTGTLLVFVDAMKELPRDSDAEAVQFRHTGHRRQQVRLRRKTVLGGGAFACLRGGGLLIRGIASSAWPRRACAPAVTPPDVMPAEAASRGGKKTLDSRFLGNDNW